MELKSISICSKSALFWVTVGMGLCSSPENIYLNWNWWSVMSFRSSVRTSFWGEFFSSSFYVSCADLAIGLISLTLWPATCSKIPCFSNKYSVRFSFSFCNNSKLFMLSGTILAVLSTDLELVVWSFSEFIRFAALFVLFSPFFLISSS